MSPTILRNAKAVESELRALHSNNLTLYQIARALQISPATVRRYMTHLGMASAKRRKDRTNRPDLRVTDIIAMRKQGFTLDSIGGKFGITRERVRQILQRECPDFVFPTRPAPIRQCAHCGVDFNPVAQHVRFCSQPCAGSAKSSTFNRDTALDVMRERDNGLTWAEISKVLGNGQSPAVFRSNIQRYKRFFSAGEQAKYFPEKGKNYFKPDKDKELGRKDGCEERQQSLMMRALHVISCLRRD